MFIAMTIDLDVTIIRRNLCSPTLSGKTPGCDEMVGMMLEIVLYGKTSNGFGKKALQKAE